MSELDGQGAQGGGYTPSQSDPVDLAAAFQMVRELDKGTAQQAVGDQGDTEAADMGSSGTGGTEQQGVPGGFSEEPGEDGRQLAPAYEQQGGGDFSGRPSAYQQANDADAYLSQVSSNVRATAVRNVANVFSQNGIKEVSVGDLFHRDEDGTVTFNNPDNPNEPFKSRADAQAWVDSMNEQVKSAFKKEVQKEERRIAQQIPPSVQVLQFAPVYNSMNVQEQGMFEDLIEPYQIVDQGGNVIGYSCNLNAMAQQAVKMAMRVSSSRNRGVPQQPPQQKQASQPAMDMKTGGSMSGNTKEPTTIEEAWRLMNAQKKGNQ